jgi:Tol biopolymer transport system component/DNA-binding winged helix-turn-helix (wHTH) protein
MVNRQNRSFSFEEFDLDAPMRRLTRSGESVALHSKAFDLLTLLVENNGQILTKETIFSEIWQDRFVEESNLVVQISNLRKALGETRSSPRFLITVPGKGYKFSADIRGRDGLVGNASEEAAETTRRAIVANTSSTRSRSFSRLFGALAIGLIAIVGVGLYFAYGPQAAAGSNWADVSSKLQRRQLTANGKVNVAALSPDGTLFAYTTEGSEESGLWVVGVDGDQTLEILAPEQRLFYGLTFSPDGKYIYYSMRDEKNPQGSLFRVPTLGGLHEKILSNIACPITFSPEGKQIAFVRYSRDRKETSVITTDTASPLDERIVASRPSDIAFNLTGVSWSPDGKFIAAGGVDDEKKANVVLLVDVGSGKVERLGDETWNHVRRVEWAPDGKGVFVNAIDKAYWQERHIWLLEYPSGRQHKITNDLTRYGAETLSVSADGSKLIGVSAQTISNIFVSEDGDPAKLKKITQNSLGKNDGNFNSLAWTPEGRLVFMRFFDKSDTLWTMDADGSNARQLTNAGSLDRKPAATSDGRYIVFQSIRSGKTNIWRMDTRTGELLQLTSDGGIFPSVTPDARTVLYQGGNNIFAISIDGGTAKKLTTKSSRSVDISPDGKFFATIYRSSEGEKLKLAVFPIEGGEPIKMFDTAADLRFEKLRWMPDGTAIVYCFYNSTAWKQSLAGGPPEKFVEFPGEIINAFDWSADGKKFALAYGQELRDVVLFTNSE